MTMFQMESIGRKIAELRKAGNMTQMELADKMNISFQAVSSWERGGTMPDISKLPELAKLFGVTIDELLGEKSELINSIADGKMDEYLSENQVDAEELTEAAPVLKPDQVDAAFGHMVPQSLSELAGLLPFVGRETVNGLAKKAAEEGDFQGIEEIAPFTDRAVMDEIARMAAEKGEEISGLAPFVSREAMGKIAEAVYEERGISSLEEIAPFVPRETLQQIAEREFNTRGLGNLEAIAPFLGQSFLGGLIKKAVQGKKG